jgi:hypothetical protein
MISFEKKFLFIHLPKTGGNSIHNVLSPYSKDKLVSLPKRKKNQDDIDFDVINEQYGLGKHATLREYKKVLSPEVFNSLYKFSCIRNPWDLCISYYFSPHRGGLEWDREKFKQCINIVPNLRNYIRVESDFQKARRKFLQNASKLIGTNMTYNTDPVDMEIDFLIRFEHLNEDFMKVSKTLNIPFEGLPHRNKSSRKHYTEYYDDELIKLVKYRFSDEIKFGGYRFGD